MNRKGPEPKAPVPRVQTQRAEDPTRNQEQPRTPTRGATGSPKLSVCSSGFALWLSEAQRNSLPRETCGQNPGLNFSKHEMHRRKPRPLSYRCPHLAWDRGTPRWDSGGNRPSPTQLSAPHKPWKPLATHRVLAPTSSPRAWGKASSCSRERTHQDHPHSTGFSQGHTWGHTNLLVNLPQALHHLLLQVGCDGPAEGQMQC